MSIAALMLAAAILSGPRPILVRRRAGSRPPPRRPTRRRVGALDPLAAASALDVFAVCLTAGMAVPAAAQATAPSAPPQLAGVLRRAADLLALGADPATAWATSQGETVDVYCLSLLRLARRSSSSGAVLATGVAELAAEVRQDAGHAATATAERAAVVIAGPLGLCFLPAFVCLGLVPAVVGLASDVFGAGLL